MDNALSSLTAGGFSIGLEAPLDNDWTAAGEQARRQAGRLPGEPDLQRHADLAVLADRLGFRALWVRDVPLYDPAFGDAGQVFEIFTYLGYLAGVTRDILLGTAAVVLPLREPLLTLKSAASVQRLSTSEVPPDVEPSGPASMRSPLAVLSTIRQSRISTRASESDWSSTKRTAWPPMSWRISKRSA